ncbi:BlaI/MecI/CopY family transcriptional regulator [Pseudonocardia sp. KRD291]|uniref:BlaI/MecI/CopY family transcriptional regulator n=1 Tax=Pseudonocardia sp. KRD291 TaxID=2792007 RepID=UPI0035B35C13
MRPHIDGRAHRYRAVMTRAESAAQMMQDAMSRGGDTELVLLRFAGGLSEDMRDRLKGALVEPAPSSEPDCDGPGADARGSARPAR